MNFIAFLDGYLVYYQIEIAIDDQENLLSPNPLILLHLDGCHLDFVMHL